mgnify:CR=1 FL=1
MTKEDEIFIATSRESGLNYGYPQCCIDEFVKYPPSKLKHFKPSNSDRLRVKMSHVNGTYTGFIPCHKHALMIKSGEVTLEGLVDLSKRKTIVPFPHAWMYP